MLSKQMHEWVGKSSRAGRSINYATATREERVEASGALALQATELCRATDDDMIQDILLHMLKVSDKYDPAKARWSTFTVFASKRVVNRKKARTRKRELRETLVPVESLTSTQDDSKSGILEEAQSPEEALREEKLTLVRRAIAKLPDKMIVMLSYRYGLTDGTVWPLRKVCVKMGLTSKGASDLEQEAISLLRQELAGTLNVGSEQED